MKKSLQMNGMNYQAEQTTNDAMYFPQPDSEDEVEYELSEAEHPRLTEPFYGELRKKYPRAFRRRTSVSSACSVSSSVCSDTSGVYGTRRTPRSQVLSPRDPHSLPPRPPPSGRRTTKSTSRDENGYEDHKRINLSRSDSVTSTCSLKERLRKNQEGFKRLLSDENDPLKAYKARTPRSNHSSKQRNSSNGSHASPESRHINGDVASGDAARTFQELQNTTSNSARNSDSSWKRTEADAARQARAKRFASPDSQNDSAVDVDTASVHSSPTSDNRTTTNANGKPVPPSRSKRKSADKKSSKSSSPRTQSSLEGPGIHSVDNGGMFMNGQGDLHLRIPTQAQLSRGTPDRGVMLSPTMSDFELPVYSSQGRGELDNMNCPPSSLSGFVSILPSLGARNMVNTCSESK